MFGSDARSISHQLEEHKDVEAQEHTYTQERITG